MKKTIAFILISVSVFAQNKSSIGLNLPVFVDNQYEFSYQRQVHKRVKIIGIVGGSPNTRGIFTHRSTNQTLFNYSGSSGQEKSDVASGIYGKIGANIIFNVPDLFGDTPIEKSNVKFYVGPVMGFSHYNQTGLGLKTITTGTRTTSTIATIQEIGNTTGTGFMMGFTFGANKDLSADFGVEYLGFERKSAFNKSAHTLGLGISSIIRVNYNF